MLLQSRGIIQTGIDLLDNGITDVEVRVVNGNVQVFSTTGRNGGIAAYQVGASGTVEVTTQLIFPPEITLSASEKIAFGVDRQGNVALYTGGASEQLTGFSLAANGQLGSYVATDLGGPGGTAAALSNIRAAIELSEGDLSLLPQTVKCGEFSALAQSMLRGESFVVAVRPLDDDIIAFQKNAQGQLVEVDRYGALQGLGIDVPTAVETVTVAGRTFVIVAASGSNSISTLELMPNGQMVPRDHLLDNATTRFEGVQAMASATVGNQTFIVVGGADNGLTLYQVLPDGHLVHRQTIADSDSTSLHKVTSVKMVVDGDKLHVFAGSQNDSGLSHFTLDTQNMGQMKISAFAPEAVWGAGGNDLLIGLGFNDTLYGGGGDDVLVTGRDGTVMTGGWGRDTFVIREQSGSTKITDFGRSYDRLDLSDLPMLRHVSQLEFLPTADGARITYRGHVIQITASDKRPLTLQDIFPNGLEGGDHTPVPEGDAPLHVDPPPPNPGNTTIGRNLSEKLFGTDRDDTIYGARGWDTLIGGEGQDLLMGGAGRDKLYSGAGNDTLEGGGDNDTLGAGSGDDYLDGGAGNDRIFGEDGNDILVGGSGDDMLGGGRGHDHLSAASGYNRLFGGHGRDTILGGRDGDLATGGHGRDWIDGGGGNDTLAGGPGRDTIYGSYGNDLLYGEGNHDVLNGGKGKDALWGGVGKDTLSGGEGDDWLSGGEGNDLIMGDAGNGVLRGGPGNDVLWGGSGADVFEFFKDHGTGRIMDFDPSEGDVLRLSSSIWAQLGTLTTAQVVERFASLDSEGNLVLDFTEVGGNVVIFDDYNDIAGLSDYIDLM